MIKDLSKFHEMVYHCTKCYNCIFINPYFVQNEDRYYGCPSGLFYKFDAYHSGGKMEIARGIIEEEITPSEKLSHIFYACTMCGLCEQNCEFIVELTPTEVFESMRRKLVSEGLHRPEHKSFAKSIEEFHNPYKTVHEKRTKWIKKLGIEMKPGAEILYFVGCTASYRVEEIAKATAKIFKKLNLNFTVSPDEWCCGSPLLRTGFHEDALKVMNHNLELIKNMGVKKVVFSCAGCYRAFKKDYEEEFGKLPFKVQHISEFLSNLTKKNKLKLHRNEKIVTYHDPCHLGRGTKVYDEPREIINSIPGTKFNEMDRNKMMAWCCGAGGGVKSAFKDFAISTSKERIREAELTNAETLLSCCPFCKLNLKDGAKKSKSGIKIMDLTEYIEPLLDIKED
ncbi:MAG: (Fe-S)-binding protein [Candidatus Helarchaeota archaeon]